MQLVVLLVALVWLVDGSDSSCQCDLEEVQICVANRMLSVLPEFRHGVCHWQMEHSLNTVTTGTASEVAQLQVLQIQNHSNILTCFICSDTVSRCR